jgi:hypothetical protein
MISSRLAAVGVVNLIARTDDNNAAELPRISLDSPLSKATAVGIEALREDGKREVSREAPSELACPVGVEARVDEQREGEVKFLLKHPGLGGCTVSDDEELCPPTPDLNTYAAQLRDLLAAEDSAEVANKDENRRPLIPELPQSPRLSIEVLNLDAG